MTAHLREFIFREKDKLEWSEVSLIATALHNHFAKTVKVKGISFTMSNHGSYTTLEMNWKTPIDSGHITSAHSLAKEYRKILNPFLKIQK